MALTPEEQNLLRAVAVEPEDDLPRLVYADWLEENGEPDRAEFIRLQCQLEATPWLAPDRPRMEMAALRLVREHGRRWLQRELPHPAWLDLLGDGLSARDFPRGFLELPALEFGQLTADTLDAAAQHPLGVHVTMTRADQRLPDRGRPAVFRRLELLDHHRGYDRLPKLGRLLDAPCWAGLRHLTVADRQRLTRGQARSLAECEALTRLTHFQMQNLQFDPGAADALFAGREFPRLTNLNLFFNRGPAESIQALTESRMPHLKWAFLLRRFTEVWAADEAARVLEWPALEQLDFLAIGPFADGAVTADFLNQLRSPTLRSLHLTLPNVQMPIDVRLDPSRLPSLTDLSLAGGDLFGVGAGLLGGREYLVLSGEDRPTGWAEAFAANPEAAPLRGLDINQLTMEELRQLSAGPHAKNLETLFLNVIRFRSADWGRALALSRWPLRRLSVRALDDDPAGLRNLIHGFSRAAWLSTLEDLDFEGCYPQWGNPAPGDAVADALLALPGGFKPVRLRLTPQLIFSDDNVARLTERYGEALLMS